MNKVVKYEIPENIVQAMMNYIATSCPQKFTVKEAVELSNQLQALKKIEGNEDGKE